MYGIEVWMWKGACGVTRWDGESMESMYERCDMGIHANGVNCRVVEWVRKKYFEVT